MKFIIPSLISIVAVLLMACAIVLLIKDAPRPAPKPGIHISSQDVAIMEMREQLDRIEAHLAKPYRRLPDPQP